MENDKFGFCFGGLGGVNSERWMSPDASWFLMMLIVDMFGGYEIKNAMIEAAVEKMKEVTERGKQPVSADAKPESAAE